MSSIDKRVVEMEFDNKQFEAGISETLASLEALKKGLTLEGATKGLADIENATKNTGLGGMADAVETIASKFSIMGAIAFTVIQNLTNSAIDFAKKTANLVWDPLIAGGRRRALNIEQAKFMFRGLSMDVEQAMGDALYAVQGTAYGLDEAARAASQLGASQVELGDDMKTALRGISGVAAMTNSSYEDTARIFTRVAGQGRVMAVDLNSIAARGLNAAAVLAESMGKTEAEIRDMVSKGEISFDIFSQAMDDAFGENATKANETYTGSLANMRAALARIGAGFFTPWLEQQRDLFNALTPAIDAVGAALKPVINLFSAWTGRRTNALISTINGINFDNVGRVIMRLSAIVRNVIRGIMSVLNPIKDAFKDIFPPASIDVIDGVLLRIQAFTASLKMGADGAEKLRRTFAGVFAVFSIGWSVLKEVGGFIAEIFGMTFSGSSGFLEATANVGDFLVALDQAIKNGTGLTNFFEGLANALQRPILFVKALASAIFELFDFDAPDPDRFTDAFEPLGRLGEIVASIWGRVLDSVKRVWGWLGPVGRFLDDIFGGALRGVADLFKDLSFDQILDTLNTGVLAALAYTFHQFVDGMGSRIGTVTHRLTQPFNQMTITLNVMQNTLRAMTLLQIAAAIGILAASAIALSNVNAADLGRALGAMSAMLTQLMLSMVAFNRIGGAAGIVRTAGGLVIFAVALRILVSSVKALAKLSWEELAKGLVGVTVLLAGLVAVAKTLPTMFTAGLVKTGLALLILSVGIKVLASAVTELSGLSWEDMARGLVGVGALLASLAIFTHLVAASKSGVLQGAGLVLLAAGIRILAESVVIFAALSWEEIGRGLAAVAGILAALAIFSQTVNPSGIVRTGVALVLIGGAMHVLADAMGKFAGYSWEEIGRGLLAMGVALGGVALGLSLVPPNALGSAAAIAVVSASLLMIASAMQTVGAMSWDQIAGAVMGLGAMLGLIAIAVTAMTTALPGAAAIFVVAAALRVLAPVLTTFGDMSLAEMARGLGMLAGVFIVLGVAGLVLGPVVPVLLGLGVAVALLGVGLALAGAGVFLFATGLTALSVAGGAAVAAVVAIVAGLISLIPTIAEQIGLALQIILTIIGESVPMMFEAMTAVIQAILMAVSDNVPAIIELLGDMALQLVEKLRDIIPPMASAAMEMMLELLNAVNDQAPAIIRELVTLLIMFLGEMRDAIPDVARAATELMVAFLHSVADNLQDVILAGAEIIIAVVQGIGESSLLIIEAAAQALIDFLNGFAAAIDRYMPDILEAGANVARAIIEGMVSGLLGGVGTVVNAARDVARNALNSAKDFLGIRSPSKEFEKIGLFVGDGLVDGMDKSAQVVSKSAEAMGATAIDTVKESISTLSDILAFDTDFNPTITPVLDLSEVEKGARKIGATLTPDQPLSVDVAYSKASDAAHRYQANRNVSPTTTTTEGEITPAAITYNQYNTSPKSLSSAEIYRQTKNQLSVTKGALTPNAT